MKTKEKGFLFYAGSEKNMGGPASALAGRLAAFATEFGLAGNVWQKWLAYILMMHDNAFTLACERRKVAEDSTLMLLAEHDLEVFMELFNAEENDLEEDDGMLPLLLNYKGPYESECVTDAGCIIEELSGRLAAADDVKAFARALTDYYKEYGTGIYGLYKAFREDPGTAG